METNQKRFVIHRHRIEDHEHLDLMLETERMLRTFRIRLQPEQLRAEQIMLEPIFDHPSRFLTYQGPVNQGKGSVEMVDKGTYRRIGRVLEFDGKYLAGRYELSQQPGRYLLQAVR